MTERLNVLVLLVRHGETLWNEMKLLQGRTDISLSETGREQAGALAAALALTPVPSIYCSPLSRARETAEIIAKPHKTEPKMEEGFIEINFGEWEGQTHNALKQQFPKEYERWLIDPGQVELPKAEHLSDAQARVMNSFQRIVRENNGKIVTIVGHGGVNRALLLSLLQAKSEAFWRVRQDVACLNIIELSEGIPRISLLNSTAHLKTNYSQLLKEAAIRSGISL